MQRDERFDKTESIIRTGFVANACLMVIKLSAGHWGDSDAVFADGIESASDLIAIGSTMIAVRLGRKPFDKEHPYGHGRAESLAALMISLMIFVTGIWILKDSVISVIKNDFRSPGAVAVSAAVLTIIVKERLYRFSANAGKHLESPSLMAIAEDHRKDAITSVATLAGVTGAAFGLNILDPLAAGLTSFFILQIGYRMFMETSHDLMDGKISDDYISEIIKLAEEVDHVKQVHEVRARRSGQYVIIDLKLDMDPEMTVKKSHDVATEVKRRIFERFRNAGDVMIHINPHNEEHEDMIRL